ncbi:MAG: DUF4159 domain-containing protein [Phycisphaerae bacterium]|nr:DUF4159 domain-containing protein [Phycisphaerae bacterium]
MLDRPRHPAAAIPRMATPPEKARRRRKLSSGARFWPAIVVLIAAFPGLLPAVPPADTLDSAISRGVKFLLDRQKEDGAWHDGDPNHPHIVGRTALVCLALLNAGESHQSPPLRRAIEFLKRANVDYTYSVSLRAAFFSMLPETVRRTRLAADTKWLLEARGRAGTVTGLYSYHGGGRIMSGDYSNSQYGVLGVWYAANAGVEVPHSYWKAIDIGWRAGQQADGGWGYRPDDSRTYASMTAAGVATLYVAYDQLHAHAERVLTRHPGEAREALVRGVDWLSRNFSVEHNAGLDYPLNLADPLVRRTGRFRALGGGSWVHYMLFGYERVGEATGLTRFGEHKWFNDGADFLIRTQRDDGGWDGAGEGWRDVNSAYALLFLARGRAPVALQKLQFDGRWNNRSRDAAQLTRWLSRNTERHLNWQIVASDASPAEFRESPILYLATDRPLELPRELQTRIRQFIYQGGVLLCVAEGDDPDVARSMESTAAEMFPGYGFRELPEEHLLFTSNFPARVPDLRVRAMSNGVRELVILLPQGDMSWRWQDGPGTSQAEKAPHFGLIGNLHLYMTDRANPRFKGVDSWVEPPENVPPAPTLRVARLRHSANHDPEPAGWQRLAAILRRRGAICLDVVSIDPVQLSGEFSLAHFTTTGPLEWSTEQVVKLREWLNSGGLLLCDAAGGSPLAAEGMEQALRQIFPEGKLELLPPDHPVYGPDGRKITQVTYRKYAMDKLPRSTLPRLRGFFVEGKLRAIASREDISSGLVGHAVDGIVGYSPQSAVDLVEGVLMWRLSKR